MFTQNVKFYSQENLLHRRDTNCTTTRSILFNWPIFLELLTSRARFQNVNLWHGQILAGQGGHGPPNARNRPLPYAL